MTVAAESDKIQLILNTVAQMSVAEAQEFKEKVKEKFGVTFPQTSAPVVSQIAEPEEKQTLFQILLTDVGPSKLNVLKTVREVFGYQLKDAKDATENLPHEFAKGPYETAKAEEIKAKLEAAGAKVELK